MQRLGAGDRSAFTPAFRLLWPSILRLCRGLLKNAADAEDAAQEAMQKILSRASEYDPRRPALPWSLAIASWECRTLSRRRQRRREQPESEAEAQTETEAEEEHIRRDLVRAAVDAMGTLSPVDRETLLSTFSEEASQVSGATFRKRRERALARLRQAFRSLYGLD